MKKFSNVMIKSIMVLGVSTIFAIANTSSDDILDGQWIRIAGGSSKTLTIKKDKGTFNVKWMNTYDFIKDIHPISTNKWSCKMIHNKGPKLFWQQGKMQLNGKKLFISDKYSKQEFQKK